MKNADERIGVVVTLHFAESKKIHPRQGFVVRFAVPPKVDDFVHVDQESIKKLDDDKLHVQDWKVVSVQHDLSLDQEDGQKDFPLATLRVTVIPKTKAGGVS